jgi:DNA-binding CsgD family transcriptional regulator
MNRTSSTFGIRLTSREREILSYIAEGLSSKQIAGKLFISEYTVANHRKNMLNKLGAKSSAELIRINMSDLQLTTP